MSLNILLRSAGTLSQGHKALAGLATITQCATIFDLVTGFKNGQEIGGITDFFTRIISGSSSQEDRHSSDVKCLERGTVTGTIGSAIHDFGMVFLGTRYKILAPLFMSMQAYEAGKEFGLYGKSDYDGIFDTVGGVNNVINIVAIGSGAMSRGRTGRILKALKSNSSQEASTLIAETVKPLAKKYKPLVTAVWQSIQSA